MSQRNDRDLHPRNAPCTCGSGKKWKRCCGSLPAQHAREAASRERLRREVEERARALEQEDALARAARRRVMGTLAMIAAVTPLR